MSMLSAQIDKLRELAADADVHGDTRHFRDPLSDAADTIWQLRDDLQRANAENAKLRERVSELEELTDHRHYIPQEWYATLEAENAKLRGYVQTLETANLDVTSRFQDYIGQYDPTDAFVIEVKAQNDKLRELVLRWYPHMVKRVSWDALSQWGDLQVMREVGIEVDG